MTVSRCNGYTHMHVLDGKLYVLGGFNPNSSPYGWIEVFDPILNK
jgi:hypothetical protein